MEAYVHAQIFCPVANQALRGVKGHPKCGRFMKQFHSVVQAESFHHPCILFPAAGSWHKLYAPGENSAGRPQSGEGREGIC